MDNIHGFLFQKTIYRSTHRGEPESYAVDVPPKLRSFKDRTSGHQQTCYA
jgi:hypothetical protein